MAGVLDEFEDEDRQILDELAGPLLSSLMERPDSPYILILDGLDENRVFAKVDGLQRLSNQLADLNCPIVLTTRQEHISSMFGDFSSAFSEFSTKKGPRRHARMLTLEQWTESHVHQFVCEALERPTGKEKKHLSDFLDSLSNGTYVQFYGQLPFNPLFLQFILEDVMKGGVRTAGRAQLLRSWIESKIWRDRNKFTRVSLDDSLDRIDLVSRIIELMENVAYVMTCRDPGGYELLESIDSTSVVREAEKSFALSSDPILAVLLNSVLVPQTFRRGSVLRITFAFRVFHEYFLASYLVRHNLQDSGYPDNVKSFYSEIKSQSLIT